MRSLAYIETIKSLSPIPNADKIEKAEVLGWEVVVQKDLHQVGNKIIYIEVDAILPAALCFEFMKERKYRVKAIKLRGQVSMGLILPLSTINEINPAINISSLQVGDDVADILQITKYDTEVVQEQIKQVKKSWVANKWSYLRWKLFGIKPHRAHGDFPSDVPKTDETRVQTMYRGLNEHQGQAAYITEKCEGQSSTFIYRRVKGNWFAQFLGMGGDEFQVCSRNRIVYTSRTGKKPEHRIMQAVEKYDILNRMKKLNRNLAIQGELIGTSIQNNIYKLPEVDMRVFLMFDLDNQEYVPYDELVSLCQRLEIPMVPVVDSNHIINTDIKAYVEMSKGKSKINTKVIREGIVIRTKDGTFSFKSINPEYLLKQD